jgi:hypothetical protein
MTLRIDPRVSSAVGALVAAAIALGFAPLFRGLFDVPTGGVGAITVLHYAKAYDYAVVSLLIVAGFGGAWLCCRTWSGGLQAAGPRNTGTCSAGGLKPAVPLGMLAVFLLMIAIHDHPYVVMDPFHEGEHLTPAFLFRDGARSFGDVFLLHGLGVDGGLDALALGDPPSPLRTRRLQTLLDAATLTLLVPIAAELCTTGAGMWLGALAAFCALGAGEVPVFPYFRLAPIFLAALGLLRYRRTRRDRDLALAFCASTLGLLWSLDSGSYALAATAMCTLLLRPPLKRALILTAVAVALPIAILLLARADLRQWFIDSFITIPRAIDAVWSLPARTTFDAESLRYYLPPILFGWLLVRGLRERDARFIIAGIVSIVAFRTAAGRCSWSHTRYGIPIVGVILVAAVLEPLMLARRRVAAVIAFIVIAFYVELLPNAVGASRLIAGWRARHRHDGLVRYPVPAGRGIYTTPSDAADLAALHALVSTTAPGATILDLANERAAYYLMQRRPATRCFDVPMLSSPPLMAEARRQLEASPPALVIVDGLPAVETFDGVSTRQRVPELYAWVDAHYPRRVQAGRFTVALK